MTDGTSDEIEEAVTALLNEADAVYGEYEQGYMDADAALSRLRPRLDALEAATESE